MHFGVESPPHKKFNVLIISLSAYLNTHRHFLTVTAACFHPFFRPSTTDFLLKSQPTVALALLKCHVGYTPCTKGEFLAANYTPASVAKDGSHLLVLLFLANAWSLFLEKEWISQTYIHTSYKDAQWSLGRRSPSPVQKPKSKWQKCCEGSLTSLVPSPLPPSPNGVKLAWKWASELNDTFQKCRWTAL